MMPWAFAVNRWQGLSLPWGRVMFDSSPASRVTRQFLGGAFVALLFMLGAPAQALPSLIGDSVTAQLLSTLNGVNAVDTVTVVDPGVEISPGDGSHIGDFLLTGATEQESIDFGAFTITLRILSGALDNNGVPVTGWAAGAEYIFSSLDIAGSTIDSINVAASSAQIANLAQLTAQNWITLDNPNQVTLLLSNIQFVTPANGTTFADVTITLHTNQTGPPTVPEPNSMVLAGLALALLWRTSRRRATRGC